MSGIYNTWDQTLYTQYLEQFDISLDQKLKEFSKGMKMKRVRLYRTKRKTFSIRQFDSENQ